MNFDAHSLTEEEKKMIEAKRLRERLRREREARETGEGREGKDGRDGRDGKDRREGRPSREKREGSERPKTGKPSRRMDIIDQLDATSIFGTGRKFSFFLERHVRGTFIVFHN